jgi:hypothetical protein
VLDAQVMPGNLRVLQHDGVIVRPPEGEDGLRERVLVACARADELDLKGG